MRQKLGALAKRMLSSLLFILLTTWLALVVLIYLFQDRLIYYPGKQMVATPTRIDLTYEDIYFNTEDSIKLHGWFVEHKKPVATLLFFHGNAGNISHRLDSLRIFHELGLSVFIIDYRGYGQSDGKPNEKGTYKDAKAAWQYLLDKRGLKPEDIIIFGRSLGGGVASWLANQRQAAALILESTFTSIVDMGKYHYPYLPITVLARTRYPSINRINAISYPVLIIHSPQDELVPYRFGEALYESAKQPKSLLQIHGGHNEGFYISGERYKTGLREFISSLEK